MKTDFEKKEKVLLGLVLMVFQDGIKIVVVTLVVRKAGTKSGELHLEML